MAELEIIIGILGKKKVKLKKLKVDSIPVNTTFPRILVLRVVINCMPGRSEINDKAMRSKQIISNCIKSGVCDPNVAFDRNANDSISCMSDGIISVKDRLMYAFLFTFILLFFI
nr:hypothetical protein B7L51_02550 [Pectobacterium carotovorum]